MKALGRHFERAHAGLDALVPLAEWRRVVDDLAERAGAMDDSEALVELMRLAALPGRASGGDGHSGIFPLDEHDRELHVYPLRLYSFPEGLYVVDAPGHRDLVGARLVAIGETPVEEAVGLVEPLVPRDNEMTVAARLPQFLMTAEVLDGLGVVEGAGEVELELELGGSTSGVAIAPVPADEYAEATGVWNPMIPPSLPAGGRAPYLRNADAEWWSTYLPEEDVVYVQYNQTVGDSFALGSRIVRLVTDRSPRGVVLDLRHNPGGENSASAGLVEGLTDPALHGEPFAVMIGRGTFSAAGTLSLLLKQETGVLFVGESSGFSTRFFGDPVSETLPSTGLVVNAGGFEWDESRNGSFVEPLTPDVDATLTAAAYFAGEDPVFDAALERLRRD